MGGSKFVFQIPAHEALQVIDILAPCAKIPQAVFLALEGLILLQQPGQGLRCAGAATFLSSSNRTVPPKLMIVENAMFEAVSTPILSYLLLLSRERILSTVALLLHAFINSNE